MLDNEITYKIIGATYKVYKTLGPGLLESIYEEALCIQLHIDGLKVERQMPVPIIYEGVRLNEDLRLDLLVEDRIIVEIKSVREIKEIHYKQLLTYLKLKNLHLGLLINFNTIDIKSSIRRVINGFE